MTNEPLVLLKSAPARRVLRGRGLVMKFFRDGSLRDRLKRSLLGRRPAERERANLERARAAGIPVPEVVELKRIDAAEECLVLREIPGARSLDELGRRERPTPERRRAFTEALAALMRRVHDAGLIHLDLHAGNILVDEDDGLHLIDLHRARFADGAVPQSARRANLVDLGRSYFMGATRTDRARFLRCYAGPEWKESARALESALEESCRRFWGKRLRRRWVASRHVESVGHDGWRGLRVTGFPVENFVDAVEGRAGTVVKSGRSATVRRVTIDGRDVAIKRFTRRKRFAPLFDLFRGSRGRRNWFKAHALRMRSLATAAPLAFATAAGPLFLPGESAFASLWVDGDPLPGALDAPVDERRRVLRAVGRAIRRLHRAGFRHRDLKALNWVIARDTAGAPEPTLIDLDGLSAAKVDDILVGRDLARLDRDLAATGVSRTDRLRLALEAVGPADRERRRRILSARDRREGNQRSGTLSLVESRT